MRTNKVWTVYFNYPSEELILEGCIDVSAIGSSEKVHARATAILRKKYSEFTIKSIVASTSADTCIL